MDDILHELVVGAQSKNFEVQISSRIANMRMGAQMNELETCEVWVDLDTEKSKSIDRMPNTSWNSAFKWISVVVKYRMRTNQLSTG